MGKCEPLGYMPEKYDPSACGLGIIMFEHIPEGHTFSHALLGHYLLNVIVLRVIINPSKNSINLYYILD